MRYLSGKDVKRMLTMKDCIRVMHDLFLLPPEEILNPLRNHMMLPDKQGLLGMMPSYIHPYGVMGIKVLSIFPKNYLKGLSSHLGIIHLFDAQDGQLLLSLDADEVTAIRTAAVSGVMTNLLAMDDSSVLALLGSGKQAHTHLDAMCEVRKISQVRVWSQDTDHADRFIREASLRHTLEYSRFHSSAEAVLGADIICTATASSDPILFDERISTHAHINAIGSSSAQKRELDTAIMRRAEVFVDDHLAASHEAGDILLALPSGGKYEDLVKGNIHQVLSSPSPDLKKKFTVFKSVGIAIEDLAVAWHLYNMFSE